MTSLKLNNGASIIRPPDREANWLRINKHYPQERRNIVRFRLDRAGRYALPPGRGAVTKAEWLGLDRLTSGKDRRNPASRPCDVGRGRHGGGGSRGQTVDQTRTGEPLRSLTNKGHLRVMTDCRDFWQSVATPASGPQSGAERAWHDSNPSRGTCRRAPRYSLTLLNGISEF
jgi:hypothetical protein